MRRALRFSLLLLAAAAPPPREPAEQAERARAAALAAQAEAAARAARADEAAGRLADQRVQSAARLRAAEARTAEAADRADALARQLREAEQALDDRARDLSPMLPLVERLSLYPAETMLAVPASPDDAVRGLLVLRGLSAELERQAAGLTRERAALADAHARIAAEAPALRAARDAQAAEDAALDSQIAAARQAGASARSDASEAAERAQAEAAKAETLKAALARLATEAARRRQSPADAPVRQAASAAASAGRMAAPVVGTVVRAWGDATDAGPATGVSYRAVPAARVVSPCGGRAVFAAPFRSYGMLLIVECGAGWHVVLGGLDRLDVRAGDALRPGEPVGAMADWDPARPGPRPSLYVELRRAGQPVDPAPFLSGQGQPGQGQPGQG